MIRVALTLAALLGLVAIWRAAAVVGHRDGFKDGYEKGRLDAEAWWLEQGAAVERLVEHRWP